MSPNSAAPSAGSRLFTGQAFVLLIEYTAPLERIDELLDAHRAWLDAHFEDGTFLVSGPRVPREGGTILATGESRRQLEQVVSRDPFVQADAARYQIVEFTPTRGPFA